MPVRRRLVLLLLPLAAFAAGAAFAARDSVGSERPTLVTASAADAGAKPRRPALRYLFWSGSGQAAAAAAGWNLLDVSSKEEADALPPRTRGLMWIGDYDNKRCAWERSDAAIAQEVAGTKNDPRVAGFLFSDEPDPFACPAAPTQHRARSRLIHDLAGNKLTVAVIDSNSGVQTLKQMPLWAGSADRLALDPYPCYQSKPCDFGWIRSVVRAADAAHLAYWGVAQAFMNDKWRWPTPKEEARILSLWTASKASAVTTFAWHWDGHDLSSRPRLLDVLRRFNGVTQKRMVAASPATEVHYEFTSATAVTFDWRGGANVLRVRRGARWTPIRAHTPTPDPFSSAGPFKEARVSGLKPGRTYRYVIGSGPAATFHTPPTRSFRFDVEADVGDSGSYSQVATTQAQIAADKPSFVLVPGDLTYGNDHGQSAVDRHFNDVMVWSRAAAYMPAWGNHEWDKSTDDLRNYKGRFAVPHPQAAAGAPSAGCCGEDWGWFDAGPVRFISYPEPYTSATWAQWKEQADAVMSSAEKNPRIRFIVTFGHRPAYSSGHHPGETQLASILNAFGDRYSKYVLNLNGHSHDYERYQPIHHVVHVTAAGGGATLEPWSGSDSRSAFRAMHLIHLRIDVTKTRMTLQAICGPSTSDDQFKCTRDQIVDSYMINQR